MNSLILTPMERFTFCYECTQSVTVESRGNSTALRQCCRHASVTTKQSHCTSCEERKSRHTHQRCHRIIKNGLKHPVLLLLLSTLWQINGCVAVFYSCVFYYKNAPQFRWTKTSPVQSCEEALTDSNSAKLRWDQWARVELGVWCDLWTVEQPVGVPRLEGWWWGSGRSHRWLTDKQNMMRSPFKNYVINNDKPENQHYSN